MELEWSSCLQRSVSKQIVSYLFELESSLIELLSSLMHLRISKIKPRSHALIYTRYVNYTYMYNLHPGVKIYLHCLHMFLKSFGLNL